MSQQPEVQVLSAVRTGIGKYGGGLASVPPCDLAATVIRDAVQRAGVRPETLITLCIGGGQGIAAIFERA
jgi:acetyl-CoA C-acetyltransferase